MILTTNTAVEFPVPHNEIERLEMLDKSEMLNPEPRSDYDSIVNIAKRIMNVQIAIISMVGKNEQFFKARAGINTSCTARDISFCTHTIMTHEPMIVLDATQDERFADNPLVTGEPHIRFYAGAPIIVPDGIVLGTLCTIDDKPRSHVGEEDLKSLSELALITARIIELNLLSKS